MATGHVILVVEDDDDIRDGMTSILELEGYVVYAAENGKKALEMLETINPCLILLDLMMPVMDGWQFAELKKKNAKIAPVPLCIVSAIADKSHAQQLAAQKYVKKPVDALVLLNMVNQFCGNA